MVLLCFLFFSGQRSDFRVCVFFFFFRFLEREELNRTQRMKNFAGDLRAEGLLNVFPNQHPSYAAGNVYLSSLADASMCQEFFRPYLSEIVHQMISGEGSTGQLFQIPIPTRLVVRSFFCLSLLFYLFEETHFFFSPISFRASIMEISSNP